MLNDIGLIEIGMFGIASVWSTVTTISHIARNEESGKLNNINKYPFVYWLFGIFILDLTINIVFWSGYAVLKGIGII